MMISTVLRRSMLTIVLALLYVGCADKMSTTEADALEKLREMGAIPSKDAKQIHVASIMLTTPPALLERMDEAIPLVGKLKYLTHIDVARSNLNDEHMKTIASLKKVDSLVLSGTQVGDEGIKAISRLRLKSLYAEKTNITADGIDAIGKIKTLTILDLSDVDFGDNIEPLGNLKDLEWFVWKRVPISSKAVDVLVGMEGLKRLSIQESTISEADITKLKSANPKLAIDRATPPEPDSVGPDQGNPVDSTL